jgi:hypothetical protein
MEYGPLRLTNYEAPANIAIEYEERDFDNDFAHDTIYRGPPTPALEQAWDKLWRCALIKIQLQ